MHRDCTRCRRPFALADLSREETDNRTCPADHVIDV